MAITPKAIQDLLDELESSRQSRLRAWNVLQRLRLVLSDNGNVAVPPPAQKTFDAEGEALEYALTKSFRIRNEAIRSLCSSVTPLPRRHYQGRMQKRLSARSSGFVESVGSGGRSDSELSMCGRHRRTTAQETCSPISHFDTPAARSSNQLEHCHGGGRR